MTEEEAKTKWCWRTTKSTSVGIEANGTPVTVNRYTQEGDEAAGKPYGLPTTPHAETLCIASACMAWRWSEPRRTLAFLEAVKTHMQGQAKPNFNTAVQAVFAETGGQFERVEGGCGLAGEVQ